MTESIIPLEHIERMIYQFRGHRVMLDSDLSGLYGVSTRQLNQQVKRNIERFPSDFMFQLTKDEFNSLKSQNVTSKTG
ncbi:MAG: ORF6N domain-containing protein [Planctomycetota bacterium]